MTDAVAALLSRARDSLADARLLAEHRRVNEVVLTRLALHQALQAISLGQGLDADDGLRLDTLFRRVPEDHPQADRIARLRDDDAQTIAAVAELVEALAAPTPVPADRPGPNARQDRAGPRRSPRDAPGSTALDASPSGSGRAERADGVASIRFWELMDRWRVGDLDALALIDHPGGLTGKGTRPRFRLLDHEAARFAALRRLDAALDMLGLDPGDWLSAPREEAPFNDGTAVAVLQRDGETGARQLLHMLNRQGLAAGLAGQT